MGGCAATCEYPARFVKHAHEPRPWIALTLGDPAGIGPEVCLRAIDDPRVREAARVALIGPPSLRPAAVERQPQDAPLPEGRADSVWIDCESAASWELGRVQPECGRAALSALRIGHELALAKRVAALVTAPVSKAALHAAGERVEGQTELLGRWCNAHEFEMLAVARKLRVLLLTRHMPLAQALGSITQSGVVAHLELLARGLQSLGIARPRIALAGLNPHAGEGGLLGMDEREKLEPAAAAARARGLDVHGPLSPDTVFLAASRGAYDGVLALYHDQAFIPVKLHAPDDGLTVIVGLPYLRVSPAHGTAFDIAGKGVARADNLIAALVQAAAWSRTFRAHA
ncbi:MAG: 4-hydroxythreonine-4-phosphate dehydrogenase PdxA [Planctomycetota bacterium]|nr:MAG: 4-hydroxythreonine-4-phosphate dehydrogenase PdxA [Planctomycetota bacterium]